MTPEICLKLPYPPSVNHYYLPGRKGRKYISEEGKRFHTAVKCIVNLARANKGLTCELRVEIEVFPPDNKERDGDNILKATYDALQYAGVYKRDSQIKSHNVEWFHVVPHGQLLILIKELQKENRCPRLLNSAMVLYS